MGNPRRLRITLTQWLLIVIIASLNGRCRILTIHAK